MLIRTGIVLVLLGLGPATAAAQSAQGSAPPDRNEACMDRKVDSSSGDCIIKDEGTPRHTYPPKRAPAQPIAKPSGPAPSSTVRGSGSGK